MFSVILTDYKSVDLTITYIKKLNDMCSVPVHYIIVDNSDEHHGLNWLQSTNTPYKELNHFEKPVYQFAIGSTDITLIDALCNGGYAKGNNIGAKLADQLFQSTYYLFSNNDLDFTMKIDLKKVETIFKQHLDVGIIGPDVISPDGGNQSPRHNRGFISQTILWDFNVMWFGCRFHKYLWNLERDPKEGCYDWVSGSFMFVSAEAFREVGGFDEHTFLYCEEMIISDRMRMKNWQTYYYPQLRIIHRHRGTETRAMRRIGHDSKMYYYQKYRNVNRIWCKLSDVMFELCENGYHLWHDLIRRKEKRK